MEYDLGAVFPVPTKTPTTSEPITTRPPLTSAHPPLCPPDDDIFRAVALLMRVAFWLTACGALCGIPAIEKFVDMTSRFLLPSEGAITFFFFAEIALAGLADVVLAVALAVAALGALLRVFAALLCASWMEGPVPAPRRRVFHSGLEDLIRSAFGTIFGGLLMAWSSASFLPSKMAFWLSGLALKAAVLPILVVGVCLLASSLHLLILTERLLLQIFKLPLQVMFLSSYLSL